MSPSQLLRTFENLLTSGIWQIYRASSKIRITQLWEAAIIKLTPCCEYILTISYETSRKHFWTQWMLTQYNLTKSLSFSKQTYIHDYNCNELASHRTAPSTAKEPLLFWVYNTLLPVGFKSLNFKHSFLHIDISSRKDNILPGSW